MTDMKKKLSLLIIVQLFVSSSFGWGLTGHRVVGQLAEWHLNKKASREISRILGTESLAMVSNWMDDVKSDRNYDHLNTWHYLTVEAGQGYDPAIQEAGGDAYGKTKMIIDLLKKGGLSEQSEQEYLKMLVHLVGDLHQPLHVGKGDDRGGNDIQVTYFNQNSNLHRVWDSQLIDGKQLSYSELATHLNRKVNESLVLKLQSAEIEMWLEEAVSLREIIYDLPENKRLSYPYVYKTFPIVEQQLLAAGIRLAGILNEIYG
jgi:hypothetical protein